MASQIPLRLVIREGSEDGCPFVACLITVIAAFADVCVSSDWRQEGRPHTCRIGHAHEFPQVLLKLLTKFVVLLWVP